MHEIDESIENYSNNNKYKFQKPYMENGKIPIGCVWTKMYVGDENCFLEMTAATSEISRLFENSSSIHKLFREIAEDAGDTNVFFDNQHRLYWFQIYPKKEKIIKPDINLFSCYSENSIIDVDAYVLEAERLAGKDL